MINSKDETRGAFDHSLGDPRIMGLLGEQSPVWHTVSMDILGPFVLKQYQDARGNRSSYKDTGLCLTDLASGLTHCQLMDGATKTHVITGLAAFAHRFRLPSVCVADSGPQLKHLDTNQIFDA